MFLQEFISATIFLYIFHGNVDYCLRHAFKVKGNSFDVVFCFVFYAIDGQGNLTLVKRPLCFPDEAIYVCSVPGISIVWKIRAENGERVTLSLNLNFESVGFRREDTLASLSVSAELTSVKSSIITSTLTILVTPTLNLTTITCNSIFEKVLILTCKLIDM